MVLIRKTMRWETEVGGTQRLTHVEDKMEDFNAEWKGNGCYLSLGKHMIPRLTEVWG